MKNPNQPAIQILQFVNQFQLETGTLATGADVAAAVESPRVAEFLFALVTGGLIMVNPLNLVYAITARGCDHLASLDRMSRHSMNFLPKSEPAPAQPNYSRRVTRSRHMLRIERPTGWHSIDLNKVSPASRARFHRLVAGMIAYPISGAGSAYYLFQ